MDPRRKRYEETFREEYQSEAEAIVAAVAERVTRRIHAAGMKYEVGAPPRISVKVGPIDVIERQCDDPAAAVDQRIGDSVAVSARHALIQILSNADAPMKAAAIRTTLAERGIEMSEQAVHTALSRLVRDGTARRVRMGYYELLFPQTTSADGRRPAAPELFEDAAAAVDAGQPNRKAIMAEVHTVYKDGSWINEAAGQTIGGKHDTKDQAVSAGRDAARERQAEHVIHNQDGTIGEKNSYGNDPRNVPG